MANSVYHINKGVNRSVEFKGLRAQYIWYLGSGLVILLIVFAALYLLGVNTYICLGLVISLATILITKVYGMNSKYGEHGMMKAIARKQLPDVIKTKGRCVFSCIKRVSNQEKKSRKQ